MIQAAIDQSSRQQLDAMILPVRPDNILLPEGTVMQVVDNPQVSPLANAPDWYAGNLIWRGFNVPVVRFEFLNGAWIEDAKIERVVIVKSTIQNGYLPYYALVVSGEPKIVTVEREGIQPAKKRARGRAEVMSVELDEVSAGIPNTDWVENHLLTYILHN